MKITAIDCILFTKYLNYTFVCLQCTHTHTHASITYTNYELFNCEHNKITVTAYFK